MVKVQDEAKTIRHLQNVELPELKKQLKATSGLFKGKERKALTEQIQRMRREIDNRLDRIPGILKDDGYPDAQVFMRTFNQARPSWSSNNRDLAAWERQVNGE